MDGKINSRSPNSFDVNIGQEVEVVTAVETYKKISEEHITHIDKNQNQEKFVSDQEKVVENKEKIEMVQEDNAVNDGADEQMLRSDDNEKLANKREEVKFIKGDHQNGDAKIDIGGSNGKELEIPQFTGMSKEELMKYANDPFWVRLRWIFFICFWAIWLAMLIGAIFLIIDAPKCAAPEPLPWYKQGPLAKAKSLDLLEEDVKAVRSMHASGVIYELPPESTYKVQDKQIEEKIKSLVDAYKKDDIKVILDITPNYVSKDSEFMKNAMADRNKRSPFFWVEKPEQPTNWLAIKGGSAWLELEKNNFVLSQFGDGFYDLRMNDTLVKKELGLVLQHLVGLGVNGFRLKNSKFYLLSLKLEDEVHQTFLHGTNYVQTDYEFWTHKHTTFQEGLGDLLFEYQAIIKNGSADAFLSVAEDVIRPEIYEINKFNELKSIEDDSSQSNVANRQSQFGIDIPIYGGCRSVHNVSPTNSKKPSSQSHAENTICDAWLQWDINDLEALSPRIDPSALALYVSLLPGVPVIPLDSPIYVNVTESTFQNIKILRASSSYMHGDFDLHNNGDLIAYSRIKSGSPGYLVVMNPTEFKQIGNFTESEFPEKMTVNFFSDNYKVNNTVQRAQISGNYIEVSPQATIILSYVPVKSG